MVQLSPLVLLVAALPIALGLVGDEKVVPNEPGVPPAAGAPASTMAKEVVGTTQAADCAAKRLTLDDGTQLSIPPSLRADWSAPPRDRR